MKKIFIFPVLMVFFFSTFSIAASSMTESQYYLSESKQLMTIKLVCVSDTDGTFSTKSINPALVSAGLPVSYENFGYSIADVIVKNNATGQPDTAGAVTITDATGRQLVGATAGDTLSVSTSASGVAYLSIDRGGGQRAVFGQLIVAIADTQSGVATSTFTMYIVLRKM